MKPFRTFMYRGNTETGAMTDLNVYGYTYLVDYIGSTAQATANIILISDGTMSVYAYGDGATWHNVPAPNVGASFWVIVTITSGSVSNGTVGTREPLTLGQTWSVTTTGTGDVRTKSALGTIQIWDAASGGNMVSSGTFKLEAVMEATFSADNGSGGGGGIELHPPGAGQPIQRF